MQTFKAINLHKVVDFAGTRRFSGQRNKQQTNPSSVSRWAQICRSHQGLVERSCSIAGGWQRSSRVRISQFINLSFDRIMYYNCHKILKHTHALKHTKAVKDLVLDRLFSDLFSQL